MKKIKALLKSKVGMTFVELITALALLVIIITSFTPMLLNSYETLYKAGERNEKTYIAKSNMENALAERASDTISRYAFNLKIENATKTMFLNMRKAMESVQNGIQTVFYGGRGTIRVVSPTSIPDDEPVKDITILFNGINVHEVVVGDSSKAKKTADNKYTVAIQVIPPVLSSETGDDLSAFMPTNALKENDCSVALVSKQGRKYADITVKGDIDVLTTVIKIIAYYVDENGEHNSTEAYVRITPATIMMVGKTTNGISYYTSKGVNVKDVVKEVEVNGKTEYITETVREFKAYGRQLRSLNNPDGVTYPSSVTYTIDGKDVNVPTEFLSVNYIDTDNSLYMDPYYVITGNNGVVQRLFITRGSIQDVSAITGYGVDKIRPIEYMDGGLTKKLFPTFWGGDKSHQFGYSTFSKGDFDTTTGYANDEGIDSCWYTGDKSTALGKADKNIYGIQTRYSMYFNGFGAWCKEEMRNGRRISYILIEAGVPLRLTGTRVDDSDRFGGFLRSWEGAGGTHTVKNDEESHWSDTKKVIRVINNDKDNEADNERAFAFLRLISFGNAPLAELLDDGEDNSQVQYLNNKEAQDLNITSSLYNPASGQMMYLGTVPAQGFLQQVDNISGNGNYAGWFQPETVWKVFWNDEKYIPFGGYTGYIIKGSRDGGSVITKLCVEGDRGLLLQALRKSQGLSSSTSHNFGTTDFSTNTTDASKNRTTFFVQRTYSGTADTTNTFYKLVDNDLEFTLGYSSNREQVFANITYGPDLTEYHNSYERYFNLSHYADATRSNGAASDPYDDIPNSYYIDETNNHKNKSSNSIYNVWFPGEFYNLTQTATKEGVTVAVGYTVSGSTYQRFQQNTDNSSTALGGVFNDGVLAILTSDSASFKNLLYFKDYEAFQDKDITDNSHLKSTLNNVYNNNYSGGYGTHARKSVRFTAVDICVHGGDKVNGVNKDKEYYAVYGDNQGRVYYSLVAKVTGTSNAPSAGSVVNGIGDLSSQSGVGDANMKELKDTNGKRLSDHFSEIVSICVDEKVIYVTGRGNGAKDPTIAVCDTSEGWDKAKFSVITLVHNASVFNINDMLVLGGNIYMAGDVAGNSGFWCAVDTTILDHCVEKKYDCLAKYVREIGLNNSANDAEINPAVYPEVMPYQDLTNPINSIAGRNV